MTESREERHARALAVIEGCDTVDGAVERLRAEGFYVFDSIKAVHARFGLGLGDAKAAVHLSPTWADMREAHDALHDSLEAALDEAEDEGARERRRRAEQRRLRWSPGPLWPGPGILLIVNSIAGALPLVHLTAHPGSNVANVPETMFLTALMCCALLTGLVVFIDDGLGVFRRPARIFVVVFLALAPILSWSLTVGVLGVLLDLRWEMNAR